MARAQAPVALPAPARLRGEGPQLVAFYVEEHNADAPALRVPGADAGRDVRRALRAKSVRDVGSLDMWFLRIS